MEGDEELALAVDKQRCRLAADLSPRFESATTIPAREDLAVAGDEIETISG